MKSQAYAKARDPSTDFYSKLKKTFEINPRHPVIKELLHRVEDDQEDPIAYTTAILLFETSTLRSGFTIEDQVGFAERIESVVMGKKFVNNFYSIIQILRSSLDLNPEEQVEEELELSDDDVADGGKEEKADDSDEMKESKTEDAEADMAKTEDKPEVEEHHTEL